MATDTSGHEEDVLAAHAFAPFQRAVDVGGAHGAMLLRLLALHADARGVVFDLPDVIEAGRPSWSRNPRIEGAAGSFFDAAPAGDLYIVKSVLHDWIDERCAAILRNLRAASLPGARVAIVEMLLPERPTPGHPGHLYDINMMAMTEGRERTAREYEALLRDAGFAPMRTTHTRSFVGVVEGQAV